MKNNKISFLIAVTASALLSVPLLAQSNFSDTYKGIQTAIKGASRGTIEASVGPKQLTSMLVMSAKTDDNYAKLNSIFKKHVLRNKEKVTIVSDALTRLFKEENYDSFLYLYDLAQKNKVKIPAKMKTDILEKLIMQADEFKKEDFFELVDGVLEYLDADEIRDNFDASSLLVKNLLLKKKNDIILETMVHHIIKLVAKLPDNLRVNFDPEIDGPAASPDRRVSLLGYWAIKYKTTSTSDSYNNVMLARVLVMNGADIYEEINGQTIQQIVSKKKPSKEVKEIFAL